MAKGTVEKINWFNIRERSTVPFQFFIGARGIGKTYSALSGHIKAYREHKAGKLLYMRMTATEIEDSASFVTNPYKAINKDFGYSVSFESVGKAYYKIVDYTNAAKDENGKPEEEGDVIGYATALSNFHNLRGVDFSDVSELYFDEFIPSSLTKTPIVKKAGSVFVNAYETINRNRELLGEEAVRCYFTANAFSMDSAILIKFGVVRKMQKMMYANEFRFTDREAGIYLEFCRSNVSEMKKTTALYKAMANDKEFMSLAINNDFTDYALTLVRKVDLKDYFPLFSYDDVVVFKHKSRYLLYAMVSGVTVPNGERYSRETQGVCMGKYYNVYKMAVMDREIFFDSAETKYFLDEVFDNTKKF